MQMRWQAQACYYFLRCSRRRLSALPLYEYKCEKCGNQFEKIEKHSAPTTQKCPKCGAKAQRMISAAGIQFKGSGWYVTDYKGKSSGSTSVEGSSDGNSPKPGDKPADSKPADSKTSESKATDSKATDSKPSGEKGTAKKKK
jgi:putative FmdB family regulatory protein